jgi:hypothetical protein
MISIFLKRESSGGLFKSGDEPSGFIKCGEFPDLLSDCHIPNKNSVPSGYFKI